MPRAHSMVPLVIAALGQVAAYFLSAVLEAYAIPCCADPTPALPPWYAHIATPIHFLVMLAPAFLCGLFVPSRPILTGAVAAAVGSFLWFLLGAHIIATVFPSRAISGLGQFQNALWSLTSLSFVVSSTVTAACYAAAALARRAVAFLFAIVRANPSLNMAVPRRWAAPTSRPPVSLVR